MTQPVNNPAPMTGFIGAPAGTAGFSQATGFSPAPVTMATMQPLAAQQPANHVGRTTADTEPAKQGT